MQRRSARLLVPGRYLAVLPDHPLNLRVLPLTQTPSTDRLPSAAMELAAFPQNNDKLHRTDDNS
jgi:hypothetical protein